MIRRETDAALVNRIANAEAVRCGVCYKQGEMDWSPAMGRDDIIVLSNGEDACAVFAETAPRVYQSHTMFGAKCRGRDALNNARDMLDYMRRYADIVWGATPLSNRPARWFNRQIGAVAVAFDHYGVEGDVEIFELRLN